MSDETKGATVTNGCDHKEIKPVPELPGSGFKVCTHCAVPIHVETWMTLHMPAPPPEPARANHCPRCAEEKAAPPPEPPKSWVRQKAEETAPQNGDNVAAWRERMLRETVEECCRALKVDGRHGGAEFLRRAMLEPKADPPPTSVTADDQRRGMRGPPP